jgi:hypothetical protein
MRTIITLAGLLIAAPAWAQQLEIPESRQGYFMGVGVRGGVNNNWEKGDSLGAWSGGGGAIRLGQLLTRRLGLGLAIEFGSTQAEDKTTAGMFGLGLEGSVRLVSNLALTGTAGLGFVQIDNPDVEEEELRGAFGGYYGLGLTYDLFPFKRRSGGFAVSPSVQARVIPGEDVKSLAVFFGVDLLWWTGLPRNQLELPEGEAYRK